MLSFFANSFATVLGLLTGQLNPQDAIGALDSLSSAGLAIVLYHNLWVLDWRVIITVLGWLAVIGGTMRIIFFRTVEKLGEAMLDKSWALTLAGLVWLVVGAVLCFFGYIA